MVEAGIMDEIREFFVPRENIIRGRKRNWIPKLDCYLLR